MRGRYGLSAAKMSEVLGFGANTYSNYEKGEMPNDSNSTLLNVANEPKDFKTIISKKENLFSENQLKTLYHKIEKLFQEQNICSIFNLIWGINASPNRFNGYKIPDFKKFAHSVIFFIKEPRISVTRLNKYLFYSDFLNFKNTGYSITGLSYAASPRAPAPNQYDYLYQLLNEKGYIEKEDVPISDKDIFERYKPSLEFDKSFFNEDELNSMKNVFDKFQFLRTNEIIDLCHKEKAWIENIANKHLISYQDYGFELKGI